VAETLEPPPKKLGVTHWSSRLLAQRLKISDTRPRAGRERDRHLRALPGPPENAIVLCVDEKSQIQALDRAVPIVPMREGRIERRSHDYYRHGTTTLFAALDIATDRVTAALKPKHRLLTADRRRRTPQPRRDP
jgi:hypothetical protein